MFSFTSVALIKCSNQKVNLEEKKIYLAYNSKLQSIILGKSMETQATSHIISIVKGKERINTSLLASLFSASILFL